MNTPAKETMYQVKRLPSGNINVLASVSQKHKIKMIKYIIQNLYINIHPLVRIRSMSTPIKETIYQVKRLPSGNINVLASISQKHKIKTIKNILFIFHIQLSTLKCECVPQELPLKKLCTRSISNITILAPTSQKYFSKRKIEKYSHKSSIQ